MNFDRFAEGLRNVATFEDHHLALGWQAKVFAKEFHREVNRLHGKASAFSEQPKRSRWSGKVPRPKALSLRAQRRRYRCSFAPGVRFGIEAAAGHCPVSALDAGDTNIPPRLLTRARVRYGQLGLSNTAAPTAAVVTSTVSPGPLPGRGRTS